MDAQPQATTNAPITFAIIGYGNIGSRHAGHILKNPDARLLAVADTDENKRQAIPEGVPFYDSIEALLAVHQPDVVSICTPNHLHEPHTIYALSNNCHALVEKPMALSTQECDNMIAAAAQNGRKIFAVKQNRYNPPVAAVKELIESGRLGKIYLIEVNCFWNRNDAYYASSGWRGKKASDGGCLFTQFSHFVDILYYLNGGISEATGRIHNFAHQHNTEFEDSGVFSMKANNGSLVSFNFSTTAYGKNMEGAISIIAEKGTLKIGGQYLNTLEYQNLEGPALPDIHVESRENDYGLYKGSMSNHDKVIQNVIDVLHHGKPMMTSAQEGRAVVKMIEQMYDSVTP